MSVVQAAPLVGIPVYGVRAVPVHYLPPDLGFPLALLPQRLLHVCPFRSPLWVVRLLRLPRARLERLNKDRSGEDSSHLSNVLADPAPGSLWDGPVREVA